MCCIIAPATAPYSALRSSSSDASSGKTLSLDSRSSCLQSPSCQRVNALNPCHGLGRHRMYSASQRLFVATCMHGPHADTPPCHGLAYMCDSSNRSHEKSDEQCKAAAESVKPAPCHCCVVTQIAFDGCDAILDRLLSIMPDFRSCRTHSFCFTASIFRCNK